MISKYLKRKKYNRIIYSQVDSGNFKKANISYKMNIFILLINKVVEVTDRRFGRRIQIGPTKWVS